MKKLAYFLSVLATITLIWWFGRTPAVAAHQEQKTPEEQTKIIVSAANDFLDALSTDQRKSVQFEFLRPKVATATQFDMNMMRRGPGDSLHRPPPTDRNTTNNSKRPPDNANRPPGGPPASGEKYGKAVWSNFPVSITKRPSIELGSLTAKQKALATYLLQVLLSAKGYEKIQEIMGSDQALADSGTDFAAGVDHYLLAIFGTPNAVKPWMIEFGGHHLGLNVVISGIHGTLTPTLTGAQPAVYISKGKTVRVLAGEYDKAFDLVNDLDDEKRKKALLDYQVRDLILGPGHDGQTIVPEGLNASEMTDKQKEMLLSLIGEWTGIIHDAYLNERMIEIRSVLNDTYFAWSGPTIHAPGRNGTAYYRIQSPKLIIEFSPQNTFGDATIHVHTVYRDPTNEYGSAYITQ